MAPRYYGSAPLNSNKRPCRHAKRRASLALHTSARGAASQGIETVDPAFTSHVPDGRRDAPRASLRGVRKLHQSICKQPSAHMHPECAASSLRRPSVGPMPRPGGPSASPRSQAPAARRPPQCARFRARGPGRFRSSPSWVD